MLEKIPVEGEEHYWCRKDLSAGGLLIAFESYNWYILVELPGVTLGASYLLMYLQLRRGDFALGIGATRGGGNAKDYEPSHASVRYSQVPTSPVALRRDRDGGQRSSFGVRNGVASTFMSSSSVKRMSRSTSEGPLADAGGQVIANVAPAVVANQQAAVVSQSPVAKIPLQMRESVKSANSVGSLSTSSGTVKTPNEQTEVIEITCFSNEIESGVVATQSGQTEIIGSSNKNESEVVRQPARINGRINGPPRHISVVLPPQSYNNPGRKHRQHRTPRLRITFTAPSVRKNDLLQPNRPSSLQATKANNSNSSSNGCELQHQCQRQRPVSLAAPPVLELEPLRSSSSTGFPVAYQRCASPALSGTGRNRTSVSSSPSPLTSSRACAVRMSLSATADNGGLGSSATPCERLTSQSSNGVCGTMCKRQNSCATSCSSNARGESITPARDSIARSRTKQV